MNHIVLRTNAIPLYGFLSLIIARQSQEGRSRRGTVLDCGAGGPIPLLALLHQR
jgi:hypothetical protein